ncbi:MAG: glutamine-hydrolyzing carbamoyl-phosphate synthase small subunit, partial [Antricoccus sp.]
GEAVFATGMTGYQETLTDPSYHQQVVVMTAPHIGNTGWNDDDDESTRIWARGLIVRDISERASNWRSKRSLSDELKAQNIVGVTAVDTRAITRHLRDKGAMRIGIFTGAQAGDDIESLVHKVSSFPQMSGSALAREVTTTKAYVVPAEGHKRLTIAAIDLGIKSMTPQQLAKRGVEVHVLPLEATYSDVIAAGAEGLFLSNGPGDPATTDHQVTLVSEALEHRLPVFGICFGNQILGRALGLETYKLQFGHRGINQPVLDRTTGKVEITAHNHGFAVRAPLDGTFDTPFGAAEVSHIGLNDNVVEGLRCLEVPAFSVQYHPEAAAGPHDAAYLFDRFIDLIETTKAAIVAQSEGRAINA